MSTFKIGSSGRLPDRRPRAANPSSGKNTFANVLSNMAQAAKNSTKDPAVTEAEAQAKQILEEELVKSINTMAKPAKLEKEQTDDKGEGW